MRFDLKKTCAACSMFSSWIEIKSKEEVNTNTCNTNKIRCRLCFIAQQIIKSSRGLNTLARHLICNVAGVYLNLNSPHPVIST